jgi:hypothetical protein
VDSLGRDKGRKKPEMLCHNQIVFSDEYPEMGTPNRATANDTPSPNYNGIPFSLGISRQRLQIVAHAVATLGLAEFLQSFSFNLADSLA